MDADAPNTADPAPHHIPLPPPPMMDSTGAITAPAEPVVANPFGWEDIPLRPGQLAPGWHTLFIAGWVLVMVSFGCVWQAARVSGIAPWWLGPETNPRFVGLIILPFIGPLIVIAAELVRWKASVFVGIVVGLGSAAFALGDLHFPGLAIVEAIIGLAGLLVSLASVAGRMRHPDRLSS